MSNEDDFDVISADDTSDDDDVVVVVPRQNGTDVTSSSVNSISDDWLGMATDETPLDCGVIDPTLLKFFILFFEKMKNL